MCTFVPTTPYDIGWFPSTPNLRHVWFGVCTYRKHLHRCRLSVELDGDGKALDGDGKPLYGDGKALDGDGKPLDGDGKVLDGGMATRLIGMARHLMGMAKRLTLWIM